MALNSINTNIASYYAQINISRASDTSTNSVARLSSGKRIVQAKDDVAAMAAGTSLETNVNVLRRALINTSQGSSLLQVADGALSQISSILQRQKAIAIQSGSGTMTASERGFLDQEFQNLTEEVDRLTANTNFNGVTLLDGSVFDKNLINSDSDIALKATGSLTNTVLNAANKTIIINGATFSSTSVTPGAYQFNSGTSISEQLDSLANVLNGSTDTRVSVASYRRSGNSLVIEMKNGGTLGQTFTFDSGTSTNFAASGILMAGTRYTLQGANDLGLGFGRTLGLGVIGDSVLTSQNQVRANNTIGHPTIIPSNLDATLNTKTITVNVGASNVVFVYNNVNSGSLDIVIGATLEETLDNAVAKLNNYKNIVGATDLEKYALDQLGFRRDGLNILVERQDSGNVLGDNNTAVTVVTNVAGATPAVASNFNNGATNGITTSGMANKDFLGTITGFTATYTGVNNSVDLEITVGDYTYIAQGVNTAPVANTTVRFASVNGGYFDMEMAANLGTSVSLQSEANTFAARLNAAISGLTFSQNRNITSYVGAGDIVTNGSVTGSLTGTSFRLQLEDFSDVSLTDIRISPPLSGTTNGIIEFDINGETYRSTANISNRIGAYGIVRFQSLTNANHVLEMRNGATVSFFRNGDEATNLQEALKDAFGYGSGGAALNFQIGTTTQDTLQVSIQSVTTHKLFSGESIDVLTQGNAAHASDVLDVAIRLVTSARAEVGALQSRFDYAANNVESSIQNQDAARGVLLDTDIAKESTSYATSQVQLQAGIAVLAQANLLPQNLLKLLG